MTEKQTRKTVLLFGKHINRYYLRYGWFLLLGVAALVIVDTNMLRIPELYRKVINGLNSGAGTIADGTAVPFDMDFLLDEICGPMLFILVFMAAARFLWRVCFFGSAIAVETDLRGRMFDRCKDLSRQFYEREKVGNLMSFFTNDLETVHESHGKDCFALLQAHQPRLSVLWLATAPRRCEACNGGHQYAEY